MLTLKKYLLDAYCSIKQTELVWLLVQNQHSLKGFKAFNLYHSFNNETEEVYKTENDKDNLTIEIEATLESEKNKYGDFISEIKAATNETYNPFLHAKLADSAKRIEELKKQLRALKSKIIPFKNRLEWICIRYDPFVLTLTKIGLPVVTFANSFWWGYFKQDEYPLQKKIINLSEKLRINVGESFSENLKLINFAFINEGLLKKEETIKPQNFYETYDEILLKNRKTLSNIERLSNTNPEKLKKIIK